MPITKKQLTNIKTYAMPKIKKLDNRNCFLFHFIMRGVCMFVRFVNIQKRKKKKKLKIEKFEHQTRKMYVNIENTFVSAEFLISFFSHIIPSFEEFIKLHLGKMELIRFPFHLRQT